MCHLVSMSVLCIEYKMDSISRLLFAALDGWSRTEKVMDACVGSASGEEEMEYCLILNGGSNPKNSPSGSLAEGYSSSKSKGERRLAKISSSKSSSASLRSFAFSDSSIQLATILATFYELLSIWVFTGLGMNLPFELLVDQVRHMRREDHTLILDDRLALWCLSQP